MKNPVQLQLPSNNLIPIIFRVENSGNLVTFTLFDDIPLNLRNGPVIKRAVSELSKL